MVPNDSEAFLDIQKRGRARCMYFKAVMCGEGRAGKSSTQRALLGKCFVRDLETTNGIDVCAVEMEADLFQEHKSNSGQHFQRALVDAYARERKNQKAPEPAPKSTTVNESNDNRVDTKYRALNSSTIVAEIIKTRVAQNQSISAQDEPVPEHEDFFETASSFLGQIPLTDDIKAAVTDKQEGSEPIVAMFYDCGGQNVYQTANELFFTGRSVVLLVFNMQQILQDELKSIQEMQKWFQTVFVHTPNSPIIVVGTHADNVGSDEDQSRIHGMLMKHFGKGAAWRKVVFDATTELCFVAVDNTQGGMSKQIQRLRAMIREVVQQQPFYEELLPVQWLRCLDQVLAVSDPVITKQRFINEVALPCGVEVTQVQEVLQRLHELGFIAWYNDAKLHEFVVTKPQAVIDAISDIITMRSRLVDAKISSRAGLDTYIATGILDRVVMSELWTVANIPKQWHDIFCLLMLRFDLICELKDLSNPSLVKFLVPAMLPTGAVPDIEMAKIHRAHMSLKNIEGEPVYPPGVFFRFLSKALRWSQFTTVCFTPNVSRDMANLAMASQPVKVLSSPSDCRISLVLSGEYVAPFLDLFVILLEEVRAESYPYLTYSVEVELQEPTGKRSTHDFGMLRKCLGDANQQLFSNDSRPLDKELAKAWFVTAQNDRYDCFVSYRVDTDETIARILVECLEMLLLQQTRRPPTVFLDKKCLVVGRQWDLAFASALKNSCVAIPVLSEPAIRSVEEKLHSGMEDNVLLEWMLMIQLHKQKYIKAIVPVTPHFGLFGFPLPNTPSIVTNQKCVRFLAELGCQFDEAQIHASTPAQTLNELGRFQAISMSDKQQVTGAAGFTDWTLFMNIASDLTESIVRESPTEAPRSSTGVQSDDDITQLREQLAIFDLEKYADLLISCGLTCVSALKFADEKAMSEIVDKSALTGIPKCQLDKFLKFGHKQAIELYSIMLKHDLHDYAPCFIGQGVCKKEALLMLDDDDIKELIQTAQMKLAHKRLFKEMLAALKQAQ